MTTSVRYPSLSITNPASTPPASTPPASTPPAPTPPAPLPPAPTPPAPTPPAPTPSASGPTASITSTSTSTPALVRFVTDGLNATIDSYLGGSLPLRRFAWELAARIDTLAGLDAPARKVTRLRWRQRAVENLQSELAHEGRPLTGDEENCLTVALVGMRTVLATLTPDSPLDPAGAARPSAPATPAIAAGGHRAATLRIVA